MTRKNKNVLLLSICFIILLSLITTIYFARNNHNLSKLIETSNHQIANNKKTPEINKKDNSQGEESNDNKKVPRKKQENNNHRKELSKIDSNNLFKVKYTILIGIESFLLGSVITLIIINNKTKDTKSKE